MRDGARIADVGHMGKTRTIGVRRVDCLLSVLSMLALGSTELHQQRLPDGGLSVMAAGG